MVKGVCCRHEIWHWVLERAVLHKKIFSQLWHISEERKKVVLRVHKVVIEILHMAKSSRFPRSCLLLENSPSPNSAYVTKMEIPARTGATVDRSNADKVLLAIMADKMANQTAVTMTMWKRPERSRKYRGWCKLLGNQWSAAVLTIGTKTKCKTSVNAKNGGNSRHTQTHMGKLEGAKLKNYNTLRMNYVLWS